MRKEYAVIPGSSIGPIRLGMSKTEVRLVMGKPDYVEAAHEKWGIEFPDKDCFADSCIQVRYLDGKADDLQFSSHPDYVCTLSGLAVHETTVEIISEVIEKISPCDREEEEFPHTYSYPGIGLSLWREDLEKLHFATLNLTHPGE